MDLGELLRRERAFLVEETRFWGQASDRAEIATLPGVVASVVPLTPDRSLFNCVVPHDAVALHHAYASLRELYAAAGVRAFTVWVGPDDPASARLLEERGHTLDSRPTAMAAPIAELTLPDPGDLEWEETRDIALVASLNDRAFGFPPPAFTEALARWPSDEGWRAFVARLDGKEMASVMTYDGPGGDCGVTGVASLPEARGKGLALRLLGRALASAKARGATTTTLQASPLGRPLYAQLGYRDLGERGMWEHRAPPP